MAKERKPPVNILGLLIGGAVFVFFGICMMLNPPTYMSQGSLGRSTQPYITVYKGHDAAFCGVLILALGIFLLIIAYRIKTRN